mmetsp:Transcript_21557/g.31891  ORF Transcript_21557/g.31891 Transcript_21557/m.31891 type:complete len:112 (+) Transcript_21557:361-696(+)
MVNRAKQRIKDYSEVAKRHSNIKSIVFSAVASDGRYLPTEWTNTFDICLASFSVIFFPDPVAGLKEIHRSLVPSSGKKLLHFRFSRTFFKNSNVMSGPNELRDRHRLSKRY